MNENELTTMEDENTSMNLYTTDEVEVEEDDGPGFGLGVVIGTGIGIAATVAFKKVASFVRNKHQAKRAQQPNPAVTFEGVDVVQEAEVVQETTVVNTANGKKDK